MVAQLVQPLIFQKTLNQLLLITSTLSHCGSCALVTPHSIIAHSVFDLQMLRRASGLQDINPDTHLVTLHYVLAGVTSQTHQYLIARYFPRIHGSTTGDFDPANTDRIINVSYPELWRKNERIRDAQGLIQEGTYIKEILGNTFILSKPFIGGQFNKVALYDAKVFQINTTQVF
jgi:hypothetical protein